MSQATPEHQGFEPGPRSAESRDATLWVVHRDDRGRAALMRLAAGATPHTVAGSPTDDLFDSAPEPAAVILGLEGDFERELEFAHRVSRRLASCRWLLVAPSADLDEVRRLFDTLPAELMAYPPEPAALRRRIRMLLAARGSDPLSRRRSRDALAARFAHWFSDLDLPELIRALDPHLARVPVLVLGEPGCGRGLVARYVHEFGGARIARGSTSLVHVPCEPADRATDLLERLHDGGGGMSETGWTIWLENADALAHDVQRQVRSWIEFGLPPGTGRVPQLRWIATVGDTLSSIEEGALDPALMRALSGIVIRIPPLRERVGAVTSFVEDTAERWAQLHARRPRRFADDALRALREYPWPGNLAELEAVVERTLAGSAADPLRAEHLRFELVPPRTGPIEPTVDAEPEEKGAEPPARSLRAEGADPQALQRLVGAVAHEMRNPLTTIRTFAELLPEHFEDEEFRTRFAELVGADVRRMEEVLNRLQEISGQQTGERRPVDLSGILEELLDERRDAIRARGLLVLRELDHSRPSVLVEPTALRRALAGVLDRALVLVPERGDVYVASRPHPDGLRGRPSVRVLLRFDSGRRDRAPTVEGTSEVEASLELIVAEAVVRAQGGHLALDTSDPQETVIVIDLPAPDAG